MSGAIRNNKPYRTSPRDEIGDIEYFQTIMARASSKQNKTPDFELEALCNQDDVIGKGSSRYEEIARDIDLVRKSSGNLKRSAT
jgi:hypothetical protein